MSDEPAESHVDVLSAKLAPREREHVSNHVRSIQAQTLDALLRIEELLIAQANAVGTIAGPQEPVVTMTEPKEDKPTAGKRKNSRSL